MTEVGSENKSKFTFTICIPVECLCRHLESLLNSHLLQMCTETLESQNIMLGESKGQ